MAGFFSISGEAGGQFRTEAEAETRAYYADSIRSGMAPTDFPYAETVFEQSQLDRVLEQGAPGEIWQPAAERNHTTGRTVRTGYGTCTSSEQEAVKLFVLTAEGITYQSDYPAGSLMKTVRKDENWTSGADGTVETYTDNEGRTVLERRIHTATNGTEHLDTYYVYDDLNRLRYVLPPQAEDTFRQAGETHSGSDKGIADYAYVYRYDGNGNCISKKMPGSEEVEMVYDKARRRVLSRDGKCRKEGKWMFWLYEETGRQAVQGICTNPDVEALKNDTVMTRWTDRGTLAGYEAPGALGQDIQLLKADYYDNYAFLDDEELLPEDRQEYGKVYPDTQKPDAAGLKTGTASYAADGSGTLTGMEVLYYDSFGRCVQKRLKNHLGETDEEYTAYTFTGLPRLVMRVHRSPDQEERKEMLRYEYDTMDRLLKVYFRLDDKEEELVCDNVYDDLGRIVTDRRNGTDNLRTGYAYNIRNWMTSIESPLFKEELHYTDGTGTPCYNGNISSISWKAGEEQTTRGYRFTYDGLDRMKTAEYGEGERLASNPNRFNEEVTAYDKTGNILGIRRMGQTGAQEYGLVDNLALTYSGNQLTKVTDNAAGSAYNNGFEFKDGADRETEYTYDENGNLTQDLNRNIKDIQYNFLNLPETITFGDGSTTEYLYDADGRKLRTVHRADGKTTTTDYAGNLIYENGKPVRLVTEYGYVSLPDGMYHYYLQDHQGNNRVVADRNGKVEEVNHYYPFGGMFANTGNVQPYKYNGKELDTQKGLNWYDYGARHYDPALERWHVQDPMQEKYYNSSQYVYCANNPVKYIDPNGCDVKPAGTAELIMIQNTLPKEARSYVRLNKDGMIDRTLLNSYGGKSLNFNNLKTMVNSDRIVEVVLDDKFTFMGQDGKLGTETMPYNSFDPKYDLESDKDLKGETMGGLSTGESGFMGKTLFPDKDGIQNSPNGNIIVIINKNLSPAGAAENYSHEANGHALLYILNGGNHKGASHQPINGQWIEGNKTLMEMIINSKKETIENMQGT